jgi:hypothetical protein
MGGDEDARVEDFDEAGSDGHLGHTHPVEDIDHRPIALFDHSELHQHRRPPSDLSTTCINSEEGGNRHVVDPSQARV